ncbi:RNA polymerase sigma factor [Methylosarcina fibrata]|uniref:RNA polymerase sigma factor n=1 Tax=Methylosarcina fibrata TaxID=105972 RepID=UPI00035F2457|nr:sigma-70 family RNA polymerase sigma factor [Methylosarcina fibrata]
MSHTLLFTAFQESSLGYEENGARHPDKEAVQVEQLYMTHHASLKKFVLSRTRSREQTEVILQEVYLRLMEISDLSAIVNPGAYLKRMANNLWIDLQRRQQLRQKHMTDEPMEDVALEVAETQAAVFEQVHHAQLLAAYQQLLRELPPPAGEVLLLYQLEGLSHREIAQKFGKSKSWVEKTIAQALLYCRETLQGLDN